MTVWSAMDAPPGELGGGPVIPHRRHRDESRWWDPVGELRGINLRAWLVLAVADSDRVVTVAELVSGLDTSSYGYVGRASKTISDALRWEVRKGHLRRLGRGRYALGRLSRSARYRMRNRLRAVRARMQQRARTTADSDEKELVRRTLTFIDSQPVVAPTRDTPTTPHPEPTTTRGGEAHDPWNDPRFDPRVVPSARIVRAWAGPPS